MKPRIARCAAIMISALALLVVGPAGSLAQAPDEAPRPEPSLLSAAELDQLTAPIALFSDPLLGAVLAAATYPLEVVEAARWLEDPANAVPTGDQLDAALQQQSWDASVKSLVHFPDVLRTMNSNLQWTERLGDAFLAQRTDVMDSVQRLRQRAAVAGSLRPTPQQTIATEGEAIEIEPTNPDVVYTPYYAPELVYGPWPWPGYPPYYFALPPGIYFDGGLIGFGVGIGSLGPLWGRYRWDWPHYGFNIAPRHGPPRSPAWPWWHDPAHRRGVPYRDAGVATQFRGEAAGSRQRFRGYPPADTGRVVPSRPVAPWPVHPATPRRVAPPERMAPQQRPAPPQRIAPREPFAPPARAAPPAFESFGRGPQVRSDAGRGSSSRSAPEPRAAPPPAPRGGRPQHP